MRVFIYLASFNICNKPDSNLFKNLKKLSISMKMYPLLLGLVFACLSPRVHAQNDDLKTVHSPLFAGENWPEDLKKDWLAKIGEKVGEDGQIHIDESDAASYDDFWLLQFSFIQHMLSNGNMVFDDSITHYLNGLADRVFVNEPDLRKKLRFYTYRSDESNAFCIADGMIFINTALIARCSGEEELAFIMAHEAAHFALEHSYEEFKQRSSLQDIDWLTSADAIDYYLQALERSQEQESAADLWASSLVTKLFSIKHAEQALKDLYYSQYPFQREGLKQHPLFGNLKLSLPASYYLADTPAYSENLDYPYQELTHPSIGARIKGIAKIEQASGGEGAFKSNEKAFRALQELARLDLISSEIANRRIDLALYHLAAIQESHGKNPYWAYLKLKALHTLLLLKSSQSLSDNLLDISGTEGPLQSLNFQLKQLNTEDCLLIALNESKRIGTEFPTNDFLKNWSREYIGLYFYSDIESWNRLLYSGRRLNISDTINYIEQELKTLVEESAIPELKKLSTTSQLESLVQSNSKWLQGYFKKARRIRASITSLEVSRADEYALNSGLGFSSENKLRDEMTFRVEAPLQKEVCILSPQIYSSSDPEQQFSQKIDAAFMEEGILKSIKNGTNLKLKAYDLYYPQYRSYNGLSYNQYVAILERQREIRFHHYIGLPAPELNFTQAWELNDTYYGSFLGYISSNSEYYILEISDLNNGLIQKRFFEKLGSLDPENMDNLVQKINEISYP